MPNVLTIPTSSVIIFDNTSAGSSTVSPLSVSSQIKFDRLGGINIASFATALSAKERFSVDGNNGRLFSVSDSLTGVIFSVNDAAGLPVISVSSSTIDVINIGTFGTNTLVVNNTAVGLGIANPTQRLTVSGNISGTGVFYDPNGNSNLWNSVYNRVNSSSASWGGGSSPTSFELATWFPKDNQPPSAGFATLDTRGGFDVLDFSETGSVSAIFPVIIPVSANFTGGMQVSIRWTCTTEVDAAYTVGWLVDTQNLGVSSLDNIGLAQNWFFVNTISSVSVPTTSGVTKVTSTTFGYSALSTLSQGDYFRVRIRRDIANDNARGDAELVSVRATVLPPTS